MTRHLTSISAGCLLLLLPTLSQATTIFSNYGPSQSYDITEGNLIGNDLAGDNLAEADTFTASATATFGSLLLSLNCTSSCPDAFTVALTANSGADSPGAVIESFVESGSLLGALNVNNPPLSLSSVLFPTLSAGTQYWITVSSDVNDMISWNLNSTGDTSDQALSTDGGTTWFSPSGLTPGAFEVDSSGVVTTTPEPATMWLLLAGMSLVAVRTISLRRN